jgi:molybdopterin molybdotransferase
MTVESSQSPAPGCGGGHDTPALALADARARVLAAVAALTDTETVALRAALGRVLGEPVVSQINVPGHTNSAMDGYALRAADAAGDDNRLRLVGKSFAGAPFDGVVAAGECVRIMTGGVVPDGADSVVMQERTAASGDDVRIQGAVAKGDNVRPAGEDLARGASVFDAGRHIGAADLGVLASAGASEAVVFRRPRVAFFSTGDELKGVGQPLAPGDIYDSNRYSLYGMLAELGVEIVDMGVIPDDPDALEAAFREAGDSCDALITSGGVSVGEADHVVDVLGRVGDVGFWRVAIKPGRPLTFGRVGKALFFGLPGNPVSVMVTFLQLVRPALVKLAGAVPALPLQMSLATLAAIDKKPGRREYQRGRMRHTTRGTVVEPLGHQGSGVLSSMSTADCFIVLDADSGPAAAGAMLQVEPFAQPVWNGER